MDTLDVRILLDVFIALMVTEVIAKPLAIKFGNLLLEMIASQLSPDSLLTAVIRFVKSS